MSRHCSSILILILVLLAAGCVPDPFKQSTAGRTRSHAVGTPDFDIEVVEDADTSATWVDVRMRLPYSSLIYTRQGQRYRAMFEVRTRIIPADESAPAVDEVSADSLLSREDHGDPGEIITQRRFDLAPGEYLVEMTVEDQNTNATAVRRQRVSVFSISDGCARFSRLHLFRSSRGTRTPYLAFHIPELTDTLEAVAKLYHPESVLDGAVTVGFVKHRADTSVANPPYFLSPTNWALARLGVDFEKPETLWARRFAVGGDTTLTLRMPGLFLRKGLYEVVLECAGLPCEGQTENSSLRQRGYLSVLENGFPRPTSIPQLMEHLVYIALPDEMKELREVATPAEQRERFETFWLKLGGSPEAARNLIKEYYTRVEDANQLFSSAKEGWKTDRGMIYIVFGPPGSIDRRFQREIWEYEAGYQFLFQWARPFRVDGPFETYLLYRDVGYERYWEKAVDRWRRGQVF